MLWKMLQRKCRMEGRCFREASDVQEKAISAAAVISLQQAELPLLVRLHRPTDGTKRLRRDREATAETLLL